MAKLDFIRTELKNLHDQGLLIKIRTIGSPQGATIVVDGKKVLNLCSNNYLGFANNGMLRQAAINGIQEFGVGPAAVRTIAGTMTLHKTLEEKLAAFKGAEATISFQSASAPYASLLVSNSFIRDQIVYGYWYSGNTDVKDWTFTMNQTLTPIYTNEDMKTPRYIKVGLFEFSLDVTTYEAFIAHNTIEIVTKSFTLKGSTTAKGYEFGGSMDLGHYKHTFSTAADITIGSGDTIIT